MNNRKNRKLIICKACGGSVGGDIYADPAKWAQMLKDHGIGG